LARILFTGILFSKKHILFALHSLASFIKGEFITPNFHKDYPAVLHINIEKKFRQANIGSKLMDAFLKYLSENSVKGVYLSTMSDDAGVFFKKRGFELLYRGKRSYFRHIIHKDVPLYIYGRKIGVE
jgi:ribosomal protein S18 acetylase RimI-like enzyme